MVGLFCGIVLLFIVQLAVIGALSSSIAQHRDQFFVFAPFMVLVVFAIALFWLLERMPR